MNWTETNRIKYATERLENSGFEVKKEEFGYCITRNGNLISKYLDETTFVTVALAVVLTKEELKESA